VIPWQWKREMKAGYLLKQNIETLLRARHQAKHDLAVHCRRSDAWLSKILGKDNRNIPLEYLDRIADFFGLATYQLFQPGISPLLERRKADRRSGRDRRIGAMNRYVREQVSAVVASLSPDDVADVIRLRALSAESRDVLRQSMQALGRSEPKTVRSKRRRRPADQASESSTNDAVRNADPRQRGAGGGE
jgi:hypothetical protein